MELSRRWARRSLIAHGDSQSALFGIVQGSMYLDQRDRSLDALVEMGFDGYAIGGLSVGEPKDDMFRVMRHTAPRLPETQPRYVMGVGKPEDLVEGVRCGVDMFDCVMPTRNARNGHLFTDRGVLSYGMRLTGHMKVQLTTPVTATPARTTVEPIFIIWINVAKSSVQHSTLFITSGTISA